MLHLRAPSAHPKRHPVGRDSHGSVAQSDQSGELLTHRPGVRIPPLPPDYEAPVKVRLDGRGTRKLDCRVSAHVDAVRLGGSTPVPCPGLQEPELGIHDPVLGIEFLATVSGEENLRVVGEKAWRNLK